MRSLLAVVFLSFTVAACCQKKADPTPTPAGTATAVPTATVKACSGMTAAKDCEACCNPKFHPAWKFSGNRCDCGK